MRLNTEPSRVATAGHLSSQGRKPLEHVRTNRQGEDGDPSIYFPITSLAIVCNCMFDVPS